jgi:hypothetical protein
MIQRAIPRAIPRRISRRLPGNESAEAELSPIEVLPGVAALTLTGKIPSVAASANVSVTPGVANLTLSGPLPGIVATQTQTGILSQGSLTTYNLGSDREAGWRFTVGASPITVTHLGIYFPATTTKSLRLWSGAGSNIGQVLNAATTANTWVWLSITPVVLSAATEYVVTFGSGGSNYYYAAKANFTFNSAITPLATAGRRQSPSGSFPTVAVDEIPTVDFKFTI